MGKSVRFLIDLLQVYEKWQVCDVQFFLPDRMELSSCFLYSC
jgi:hypothetical protein